MVAVPIYILRKLSFILIAIGRIISSDDCPQEYSESLQFTSKMPREVLTTDKSYESINCCVTGSTSIVWTFRRSEKDNWTSDIPGTIEFSKSNMKIIFISVKDINRGFYRCTATNGSGSTIDGITELITGCTSKVEYLKINKSPKTSFSKHDHGELCCNVVTYTTKSLFFGILMSWSKRVSKNDDYTEITEFNSMDPFQTLNINRYSIWWNTTRFNNNCSVNIRMTTCLEIVDMHFDDSGYYECYFQQMNDYVQYEFNVNVIIVNNLGIYLSILAIACFFSFVSYATIWVFYFDLSRIYRNFFQSSVKSGFSIDIVILYDDQDITSLSTALLLSDLLSNKGFSAYLHDRDQNYGVDTYKEYLSVMTNCNLILFLFTPLCLENESMVFCLQNSVQFKEKKLFAFISSRKTIIKSLVESKRNEQICKLVKSARNYGNWKPWYDKNFFMRRRFISWIISYLPGKPFIQTNKWSDN